MKLGFGYILSFFVIFSLTTSFTQNVSAKEPEFTPVQIKFFEEQIRPLMSKECYSCHSADKQKGELRLDARSLILQGGESGPAVEPGKPTESLLIEAINYEGFEMPPKKQLAPKQIELLTKWKDPDDGTLRADAAAVERGDVIEIEVKYPFQLVTGRLILAQQSLPMAAKTRMVVAN